MNRLRLNQILFKVKSRKNLFIFILSLISLGIILLKLVNIDEIIGISDMFLLGFIYQIAIAFSTIFTILFLPTYPIFFIFFKEKSFNFLEKLSLTIIINSVFYIVTGYIGYWFGIPLTGTFFFCAIIILFFPIIFYIIYSEFKNGPYKFLRSEISSIQSNRNLINFSLFNYFKKLISVNALLLIVFIFLICISYIVKVSYFGGTDPWLHVLNSRIITDINYLPLEGYHGTMGLNIFGAVIYFFSGINHLLIPRYFVFYTFFVSALIFYNILMRIFRNKNLAIFGVFILEFSSLGFSTMMLQYWPSGSALIKCLAIFFLLYVRLQDFIQPERPSKNLILKDIFLFYILIILIFISAVLTHVVTSMVLLISFLWLYFVYFIKDYRRGVDFIFLCGLIGIGLILNLFGIGSGHYWFFIPFDFPIQLLILGAIMGGIVGIFFLWRVQKSIIFTKGRYKLIITGKRSRYYKKIEDKIIIPLIFSITISFTLLFLIANLFWFNFHIVNIFYVAEILIISSFAIWGFVLYQKKPKGKPLFLWSIGLLVLLAAGFIFNILFLSNMIWQRILYLIPPAIVIGFVSYIYKLIKIGSIRAIKLKILILFLVSFSLFSTCFYDSIAYEVFNLKRRDVSNIRWYSRYTSNRNVIISEFGWSYIFKYYDYPFDNRSEALLYNETDFFLKYGIDLFPPENHFDENGTNILQEIKSQYGTDVYIIFDGIYIINKDFELFGQLTDEEEEIYYTLDYLNKICSSMTENGEETPTFWVI